LYGGTGNTKVGGNYAMSIAPQMEAASKGYSQVLWLYGDELEVTEVGTMSQLFLWPRKDGKRELVTAPLDGTILPGVTRDSILQLARDWGEFEVTERVYYLKEVLEAIKDGRMIESFGAGTAAIVSPVEAIFYDGTEHAIPLDPTDASAGAGPLTQRIANTLMDIQYGETEHKDWSKVLD
jgi:branched-chain amino acid aminotransferase